LKESIMTNNQIQQELSIIKTMIKKTRKETAESGHFLISIGISSMLAVFIINRLEIFGLNILVIPVLILLLMANGIIGYITVGKKTKREKVKSYPKTICYNIWFACVIPTVMIVFLFPLLKFYPWHLTPVFVSMIMGIAVFSTGIIFESKFIIWSSIIWWVGAVVMSFVKDTPRMWIMITIIFIGWVIPGLILNKQYKQRSRTNGS